MMMSISIKDLNESKELDRTAMAGVRGGLNIGAITMVASQNQNVISGSSNGNITAVSAPSFQPQTTLIEASPVTNLDMDIANLANVANSQVVFA
jgi:hypothetical protein